MTVGHGADAIVLVGGYGVVGLRIARRLAERYPGRVVVAGRRLDEALAAAHTLGDKVRARRIDGDDEVSVREGLTDASVVVACFEQRRDAVLREVLRRGLTYGDLSPKLAFRRDLDELDAAARTGGARLLMGIGVCPGVSSVLARTIAERLGRPLALETSLIYGMGDLFGPDSLGFTTRVIGQPFEIFEAGRARVVRALSHARTVNFPAPFGPRVAHLFPFSDAVMYPSTLGASSACARLAFEPPWVGTLLGGLGRIGVLGRVAPWLRGSARLRRWLGDRDAFALVVTGRCRGDQVSWSVSGNRQADMTAIAATELIGDLVQGHVARAGLWMPEQVIEPEPFLDRLAIQGIVARALEN